MNLAETMAQLESQLQEIAVQEEANQKEQASISEEISRLEKKIEKHYKRQNELDSEALELCRKSDVLQNKLDKIRRITAFSQEFKDLKEELQDNEDLLKTLYSSISAIAPQDNSYENFTSQATVLEPPIIEEEFEMELEPLIEVGKDTVEESLEKDTVEESLENNNRNELKLTIEGIKTKLPNAERLYQQLVANYLEQYHTYQNLIVDDLDLIWCSVAFIAYGRPSYRQMSFKYHPDLDGSEDAMQMINTAWEISQEHLKKSNSLTGR